MYSLFDDPTYDLRVAPVIEAIHRRPPSEAALRAASLLESDPSPAMLEHGARWLEVHSELARSGLSPSEILRVFVRAQGGAYKTYGPSADLLVDLFVIPEGAAIAREVCAEVLQRGPDRREKLAACFSAALARLAQGGELVPSMVATLDLAEVSRPVARIILAALPMEQRETLVLARASQLGPEADPYHAEVLVEEILGIQDLVSTPAVLAARDRALALAEEDQRQALEVRCAAPIGPPDEIRPTPSARQALEYWLERRKAVEKAARLGALAQRRWPTQHLVVAAPELRSLSDWAAASAARKRKIAEAVALAAQEFEPTAGWRLVELRTFGGPPIAVFSRGEQRFCLVPGGLVDLGLSERELSIIRSRAEEKADCDNHFEQYGSLFEQVELMRPLRTVQVGALLAAQEPGLVFERASATDALEKTALRLPSEAEWEHLARGGRMGTPTYRGDEVPDTPDWYRKTGKLGTAGANAFGLWGFGYEPEICADVFSPSYDGLPQRGDASPRLGEGPRVVRGGAAQVFPFQDCGEWQLLLSAMRTSESGWQYAIALRYVLGVGAITKSE